MIFNQIADWLITRAKRTPYFHLPGYMNRWWLVPYNRFFPAVRIHEILRSDEGRDFHDHPWPYLSIILKGSYTEVKPVWDESGIYVGETRRVYGPGSVIFRKARSWHRLEVEFGRIVTTLFITGKYQQRWGFLVCAASKTDYRTYLNLPQSPTQTERGNRP